LWFQFGERRSLDGTHDHRTVTSHYLRYSLYSFFRLQIRLTLVIFGVGAVFLDVAAVAGFRAGNAQSPPLAFAAFFTLMVLWVTYWFGFRIAYWLEVRDGQLFWRAGIRSGTIPIQAVTSIGALALLSGCRGNPHCERPDLPLAYEVLPDVRRPDGPAVSAHRGEGWQACSIQREATGNADP
jgi:hypothetical protein